ncbi:unnamed protein product, partial [Meganyctiphanes norvegica]
VSTPAIMAVIKPFVVSLLTLLVAQSEATKLQVSGTKLTYGGETVFLNGVNIAWNDYGNDFGNGAYDGTLEQWITDIANAGGNSIRIWVHVEGYHTPVFDNNGYVTSCDTTGDFVKDMKKLLDHAQAANVLVIPVLWNGAYLTNQKVIDLIWDDNDKLDSYFNNCLDGLVNAVKDHPALGAWEVVNEPEGSIKVEGSEEACYDTTVIGPNGAGWTGLSIPMEKMLRFIGRQNAALRERDPNTLITLGSWGQFAQNDAFSNSHNHYTDECLNKAAGSSSAHLDFYQMHTYDWGGYWSPNAPFTVDASDYKLDKPNVIGEFASVCALGTPLNDLFEHAYTHGYNGAWTWQYNAGGDCTDSQQDQQMALGHLKDRTDNGLVAFPVN